MDGHILDGTMASEISHLRISVRVWTQIDLNGSSGCSATAIKARMTGSESGTLPDPATCGERFDPTSMIVRMSLMTCSFSTAYLVSRESDLQRCSSVQLSTECVECRKVLHNVPVKVLAMDGLDGPLINQ